MKLNKKYRIIVILSVPLLMILTILLVFYKTNIADDSFVKTHITHNGVRYEKSSHFYYNESEKGDLVFEGYVKGEYYKISPYYSSKNNSNILTNKRFVYFKNGEEPSIFDIEFSGYDIIQVDEIYLGGNGASEFYFEEKIVSQFDGNIVFNSKNLKECEETFDKQNCYRLKLYSKADMPIYLSVLLYCVQDNFYIKLGTTYYEVDLASISGNTGFQNKEHTEENTVDGYLC